MEFIDPVNPAWEENYYYIWGIVDHFSNNNVRVQTPENNAYYAVNSFISLRWPNIGPPQYLIPDTGTDYLNTEIAICCTLFSMRHSPRTTYTLWTNILLK